MFKKNSVLKRATTRGLAWTLAFSGVLLQGGLSAADVPQTKSTPEVIGALLQSIGGGERKKGLDDFEFKISASSANDRNVYRPGERASVDVFPYINLGGNLASEILDLQLKPGEEPFQQENVGDLEKILFDGKDNYGSAHGVALNFWNKPEQGRYVDIDILFKQPVAILSAIAVGTNLNEQYGIANPRVTLYGKDNTQAEFPMTLLRTGSKWEAIFQRLELIPVKRLTLRMDVRFRLNLSELILRGRPLQESPTIYTVRQWSHMEAKATWRDAEGRALASAEPLPLGKITKVVSPELTLPGYYSLEVEITNYGELVYSRKMGIVVLPDNSPLELSRDAQERSFFGMTHHDIGDRILGATWIKTVNFADFYNKANETFNSEACRVAMAKKAEAGFIELPILMGSIWKDDSTKPISKTQLDKIRNLMTAAFQSTPDLQYCELGLEENLQYRNHRSDWPYFWENLAAKAATVREAAKQAGSNVKFLYQIAEFDFESISDFINSPAYEHFSILSLHPYAWGTFPMPDEWMADLLQSTRGSMKKVGREVPIWFTEIGAPHHGNPGGFFGYPSTGVSVGGLSPRDYAIFLVRSHVIAASEGVEKMFWYNYKDQADDPCYVERHFGVVDCFGFPRPGYAAYANLVRHLQGKTFSGRSRDDATAKYLFQGSDDDCLVIWSTNGQEQKISAASLGKIKGVVNTYGTPTAIQGDNLVIGDAPVLVTLMKE